MPRKTLLTAAIVTLLLGVVALAPQVPAVRNGLLDVLLNAAERQGITVTYQRSAGNLWRTVSLFGVTVEGPGTQVELDHLRLDYFLPSLLGGELPLDVEVDGARGAVDLKELTSTSAGAPGDQGGGFVPRVRLGNVHLSGVEVNASQVPFTLPDAQITDLSVRSADGSLHLAGTVSTKQGSAHATGILTLSTLDFTGFIDRADVTLAQHWWPGAKGGSVTGPISVRNGAVVADLDLTNGSIDDLGLTASGVNGTVLLDYPVIKAQVSGHGMGGPVTATGEVDIAAMRFTASGRATPALADAAAWLLKGALDGQPFDIAGTTQVDLTISGWTTVEARGTATGAGAVNGLPLDDLAVRFAYGSTGELRVDSSTLLGGGKVALSIAPGARGASQLQVTGSDVDLTGFEYAGVAPGGELTAVALAYAMGANATARLTAAWNGALGADPVALDLDARLDPDGWQAFVSGHTSALAASPDGVDVSGALVLANDHLEGGLNAGNIAVPGLTGPATLALKASGPLNDVALDLELGGQGPVGPAVAGVDLDLRGSAAARLADGALGPITGRFGPLSLAADVGPDLAVTGSWAMDEVSLTAADGVSGSVSARSGRIEYAAGALSVTANAQLGTSDLGPVAVAPTAVALDFGLADVGGAITWNLRGHGEHLALAVGSATPLAATVAGLPVRLAGAGEDEPWAALSGAVEAAADGGYELDAQLPAGSVVAGLELPTNLALEGAVPADLGSLRATATVGGVAADVTADWTTAHDVKVNAAGIDVAYDLTNASWTARGNADVATLTRALGLGAAGLTGEVTLDLSGTAGGVSGPANITITAPVTLTVNAVADGENVTLDLAGDAGGLPITGSGSATLTELDAAKLSVNVGPLEGLVLTPAGVTGRGVVARQAFGPLALAPTPWTLEATWAALTASMTVGGQDLTARLVDGGLQLAGALAASLEYAGATYDVLVSPGAGTAVLGANLAALPVRATVTNRATGERLVTGAGSLADLAVTLAVGAEELTAALPESLRPDWRISGSGTVNLLAGPSYRANLNLVPGPTASDDTPLTARLTGLGAQADLNVDGAGIYLSSEAAPDGGRLRLRASAAPLDRYLPAGSGGDLSGTLVLEAGKWSGALTANLTGPLAASVTFAGAGEELRVSATATGPAASTLVARGSLLPRLHLTAQASALDDWVSADLVYDDGLKGQLQTRPLDLGALASVPPLELALDYDPATGSIGLTQGANAGGWRLENGQLSGALTVPVATAAGTVDVEAAVRGSLADAEVVAQLSGAVVGSLTASAAAGAEAALSVPAASVLAAVPALEAVAGLLTEPLTLDAALATSGAWTATALTAVESGATSTVVRADLGGDLLDYSGALLVQRDGAALATADVTGSGADLRAALDLGAVNWTAIGEAFGTDLRVDGTGSLTLATQPLAVGLTLDLQGRSGGNEVRVHGTAPNDLHLSLSGPAGELNGLLAWTAEAGAPPQARLEGTFGNTTVSALVGATPDGGGNLSVRYGAADLSATVGPNEAGAGRGIAVRLQAPPDSVLAYGVVADAALTLQGNDLSVNTLNASITGLLPDAVTLQAAGAVTPALDLGGSVTTPALPDAAAMALVASDLTLSWRDLQLRTTPSLATFALQGSASEVDVAAVIALLPDLPAALADVQAAVPASDLSWSRSGGFSGRLHATASSSVGALAEPLRLSVNAVGDGQLLLDAGAWLRGEDAAANAPPAAHAAITLAADPVADPSISGHVELTLALEQLLAAASAAPTALAAHLTVGGTLTSAELHGTATLTGAISATGPVAYAGAAASADLKGPNVTATFEANQPNGGQLAWQGRLRATDFDLAPWVPQVTAPRLNLAAAVSPAGILVDELVLTAPNSRVTGKGGFTLGAAASADFALSAQLNLADVNLTDAPLVGTLHGPLSLTALDLKDLGSAVITGSLNASGLGVVGFDGSVSGGLSVGGTVADPSITANLVGDGRVTGTLAASGRPAGGELNLTSDLAVGQFATDLRASLRAGVASAAGSARYGEAVLLFAGGENGDGPTVVLTGAGRLAGFSADVAADLGSASLAGDLSAVSSSLAGKVSVALDANGDGPWLQASVYNASAGGIDLGDIHLTAPAALGRYTLTSEHLTGAFTSTTGEWKAALTALEVGAGITVNAAGSGSLSSVRLQGSAAGPDLDLALDLAAADGSPMTVALNGRAYGGAVALSAERGTAGASGSWTGTATLAGAELAGMAFGATGTVIGEGALPQLVLSTNVEGSVDSGISAVGRATISTTGVTLDQIVSGAPLSQSLRVQGRLWPTTDLNVATLAETPAVRQGIDLPVTSQVRLRTVGGLGLRASGTMRLDLGPARLALGGQDSTPQLTAQVPGLPQLRAVATLTAPDLVALVSEVVTNGIRFEGADAVRGGGVVTLAPAPTVTLADFGATLAGIDVRASGTVSLDAADLAGEVVLATDLPLANGDLGAASSPVTEYTLPWTLVADAGVWRLAYAGELGTVLGKYEPVTAPDAVSLDVNLNLSGGVVRAELDHRAGQLTGNLHVDGLRLVPQGVGAIEVNAEGSIADGLVGGSATLDSEAGRLTLSGSWGLGGLLPAAFTVGAPSGGRIEARLRNLELSLIPAVHERAPFLSGSITGVLQLRDELVFGQLVSLEVTAGGASSSAELAVSGSLSSLDATLRVKGGTFTANLSGAHLSGSGRFERFPAQFVAQAVVGPSDVTADVTGVLRFDLPLTDVWSGYLRLATEEVRLERAGVPTVGNLSLTFDDRALVVEHAEFVGLGSWEARGQLREEDLDFRLEAAEADFTPLLGLFPSLARLGVGASGSLTIDIGGDLAQPSATVSSPGLDFEVAGSRYRLEQTEVTLEGTALTVAAQVSGVSPLAGRLDVSGGARLSLAPVSLNGVQVNFDGSADVAGVGVIEGLTGAITKDGTRDLALTANGRLGSGDLTVTGSLLPLDLQARGQGLTVAFTPLLVANALVDADLTLVEEPGGVALGGSLTASEVIVDPSVRPPAAPAPAASGASEPGTNALAGVRFADLAIRAPQRVLLTINLASAEAALDLVLSGTAAAPRLVGSASTLRGNLRFSGRDYTIDHALATWGAGTGLYPALDVAAHAEFDKSRVVAADNRVSFVVPREGQTFVVNLAFTGQMVAAPANEGGFRFDLQPRVSSDARIEVEGDGTGSGVRSFTEAELVSLITLGRFELNAGLIGTGGLGQAVAQGALDTAVDLLVVSELANAIREALGLDVVEIRTSALSSLIDASEQPFGVSLRLGGYLNPDLFASYRIGTYDGPDRTYSVTNEVLLSYGLGPLDLDLTGRIDFPAAGVPDAPRPEIGVSLSYSFGPTFGLDTGVTLSTDRSAFQVGVTLRW